MKVMQIREFLRGGYKDIREMTLITNHGRPVATWNPHPYKKKREPSAEAVVDSSEAHTLSPGK